MKKLFTFVLLIVFAVSVFGCKSTGTAPTTTAANVTYATGFTIENLADGVKKVTDGETQTILLVPSGKKAPAGYESATVINTPVTRVVILSVTFGALMRPLGVLDSLVGSGTVESELYIQELKDRYTSGQIKYVGAGGMGEPDYEAVSALKPDLVILSTGYPGAVDIYNKIKGLGLHAVVCNDFLENDYLARLEWIKFIAAFYNKDGVASTYFDSVKGKIEAINNKILPLSYRPTALWASIFMGSVYVSGKDSYIAKGLETAGAFNAFSNLEGSGSLTVNLEELYARGKDATYFIYASTPPYINSIKEITSASPILADMASIKSGQVYCFQPWYFQIADKPDEIIQDLAFIFHPQLFPGYQLKNFMQLPAE
ncbi:MAG: ABC transporter substrate-binding protein [Dehalococcoidales bacterium]|nr:ABC transporter substrate-binding protein [Dehalococcoidales bacterium]